MDGVAPLLASAGSIGSGVVALALLIVYIRHTSQDRANYSAALEAAEARHATEVERLIGSRDREITELRVRIDAMDARINELTRELDAERRKRWRAEDVAAESRRPA